MLYLLHLLPTLIIFSFLLPQATTSKPSTETSLSSLTQLDIIFPQPFQTYSLPADPPNLFPIVFTFCGFKPFLPYGPIFEWKIFSHSNLMQEIASGNLPPPSSPDDGLDLTVLDTGDEDNLEASYVKDNNDPRSVSIKGKKTFLFMNATHSLHDPTAGTSFILRYNLNFPNCYRIGEPEFGKSSLSGEFEFHIIRPDSTQNHRPHHSPQDNSNSKGHVDVSTSSSALSTSVSASNPGHNPPENGDPTADVVHPIDPLPQRRSHHLGTIGMLGSGPDRDGVKCAVFEREPDNGTRACRVPITDKVSDIVWTYLIAVEVSEQWPGEGRGDEEESLGEKTEERVPLVCWGYIMFISLLILV